MSMVLAHTFTGISSGDGLFKKIQTHYVPLDETECIGKILKQLWKAEERVLLKGVKRVVVLGISSVWPSHQRVTLWRND